jgi:SAM-dependent methyltransferase
MTNPVSTVCGGPTPTNKNAGIMKRVQAWALAHGQGAYEEKTAQRKAKLFRDVRGTVLEIGPGAGANLPYLGRAEKWIGVEPNPYLHPVLKNALARAGIDGDILSGSAEAIPLPDATVNTVVCSLVLCSVGNPQLALSEIRRILKPSGRFLFMEHVAAPEGSVLRGMQHLIRPLWKLLADGCHPDRDTEVILRGAGFSQLTVERFVVRVAFVAPHIMGIATV